MKDLCKCQNIMNRFLELDKNQRIPLDITLHLLLCKKCRTEVRLMTKAQRISAEPLKIAVPFNDDSIQSVLSKINPSLTEKRSKNPISLTNWVISGVIMILLLVLFGLITAKMSSSQLELVFYLMFASLVSVYCALFVGCNMDFFVKKIETYKFAL